MPVPHELRLDTQANAVGALANTTVDPDDRAVCAARAARPASACDTTVALLPLAGASMDASVGASHRAL
jgi:hypothetical protein